MSLKRVLICVVAVILALFVIAGVSTPLDVQDGTIVDKYVSGRYVVSPSEYRYWFVIKKESANDGALERLLEVTEYEFSMYKIGDYFER